MNRARAAIEVLWTFLKLGVSSFGGPVAHLGYFRHEFVEKRGWISMEDYGALLSLCQFLPGPASSQTGFCIGLKRAGLAGGVAAWVGFTLPSALAMAAIAHYVGLFQSSAMARGVLHGLQLAAVAVVAQAVWLMARSLCPDTPRRALALLATAVLGLMPNTGGQLLVLVIGALTGWATLDDSALARHRETRRLAREWPDPRREIKLHGPALLCLALFAVLLLAAFLMPASGPWALAGAFYRSGALVFGGGHVVLPLLRDAVVVPGWVSPQLFLSGYGAAQAMPGPLFTVASFLGEIAGGNAGAAIATVAIFLPGLLIVAGALPYWQQLQERRVIAAMVKGLNAAVVGLLGAAFINLLTLSTISSPWDLPIALGALLLLTAGEARPILVVAFCAAAGAVV
jgi:chromate transporter